MTLYSDFGPRRTRQIIGDVVALGLIVGWSWLGIAVYTLVRGFAEFGQKMEEAGKGLSTTMSEAGTTLSSVPLIGREISAPFDLASRAGVSLEAAGQDQQLAVNQFALGLGIGIAALPIIMILLLWLVPRIRFARKSGRVKAAVRAGVGIDLLALRALATQQISTLSKIDPDAMAAWRRGDQGVMRALANLELKSSGVRLHDR
jgi:Na+(H+)/acetate symporter ActP